ncbi:MAG: ribosomal protein L7/L12 [Gammaproteobacteria bacterium]|nr:ribosomal protein L7/L12 [Gammaproteobacteria bacterium]
MTSNITESKTGPIFFDVVLNGYKGNKITAIKSVRTVLGLGLKEAKDAVENPPNILSSNVSLEEANRIAGVLMNAGVNVSIRQHQ